MANADDLKGRKFMEFEEEAEAGKWRCEFLCVASGVGHVAIVASQILRGGLTVIGRQTAAGFGPPDGGDAPLLITLGSLD